MHGRRLRGGVRGAVRGGAPLVRRAASAGTAAIALFACGKRVIVARPADATGTYVASPSVSVAPAPSAAPSSQEPTATDDDHDDGPTCDDLPFSANKLAVSPSCPATVRLGTEAVEAPLADTWQDLAARRAALDPPECAKPPAPRTEAQAKQTVCRPPCGDAGAKADQCPAAAASWTVVTQRKDGATSGLFVQPIRGAGLFYREIHESRGTLHLSARVDDGYLVVDEVALTEFVCETDRTVFYPLCGERPVAVSVRRDPRVHVRVRGSRATLSGPGCSESLLLDDEGDDGPLIVWDPAAGACRTSAGPHPGGWAGCTLQCRAGLPPPTGLKCLTGSSWVCCDGCYCDRGSYDVATHACR